MSDMSEQLDLFGEVEAAEAESRRRMEYLSRGPMITPQVVARHATTGGAWRDVRHALALSVTTRRNATSSGTSGERLHLHRVARVARSPLSLYARARDAHPWGLTEPRATHATHATRRVATR